MTLAQRHNVKISGSGQRAMVFAHGFGCDQNITRFVAPAFAGDIKVILIDYEGPGRAEPTANDTARQASLQG